MLNRSGSEGRGVSRMIHASNPKKSGLYSRIATGEILREFELERKKAEKEMMQQSPEYQLENKEREPLKKVSKIEDEIVALREKQRYELRSGIFEAIKMRVEYYLGENPDLRLLTNNQVKDCLVANKNSFLKLKELSKDSTTSGHYTQYENLFIDLVNYNIKFIYAAPESIYAAAGLKLYKELFQREGKTLYNHLKKHGALDNEKFLKKYPYVTNLFEEENKNTSI